MLLRNQYSCEQNEGERLLDRERSWTWPSLGAPGQEAHMSTLLIALYCQMAVSVPSHQVKAVTPRGDLGKRFCTWLERWLGS